MITKKIRHLVIARAGGLCEVCHTRVTSAAWPFTTKSKDPKAVNTN